MEELQIKYNFKTFVHDYVFNFAYFSKNELIKKNPAFFPLVVYIDGVARTLDRISRPSIAKHIHSWGAVWVAALLGGLLGAISIYYIFGSIYHLGVKLAGGKKDITVSRNIATYSILPLAVMVIISELFATILYGNGYFDKNFSVGAIGIIFVIFQILAIIVSIQMGYKAVREIQETKKIPSILLFIIFPSLLYFIGFVALAFLL